MFQTPSLNISSLSLSQAAGLVSRQSFRWLASRQYNIMVGQIMNTKLDCPYYFVSRVYWHHLFLFSSKKKKKKKKQIKKCGGMSQGARLQPLVSSGTNLSSYVSATSKLAVLQKARELMTWKKYHLEREFHILQGRITSLVSAVALVSGSYLLDLCICLLAKIMEEMVCC